ncbi:peptidoglycan-binding protein [Pseudoroseicyclus sp. H15]
MRHLIYSTALAALTAGAASADDAALLIGIEQYETLGVIAGADDVTKASSDLNDRGFTVLSLTNGRVSSSSQAIAEWIAEVPDSDRLLVALTGRFATDGTRSWLIAADANSPTIMTIGQQGISIDGLLEILADRPRNAVLFLGAAGRGVDYDDWLREELGPIDVPDGVTVVTGPPNVVAAAVNGIAAQNGTEIMSQLRANDRLNLSGYVPRRFEFLPEGGFAPAPRSNAAEEALWQGALALDTVQAYRNYLSNYPVGRHASDAEAAIEAIISEPNRAARLVEEAMRLDRDERQDVQRDLTMLGYNTRGIDGIFGPGTRGAVTNWQQENGFPQTSYLTPDQITRIDAQAARRAAELEAEAERRAAAERRADNSFWEETGREGDEAGLRAYLERYPDGIHAEEARDDLQRMEEAARQRARAAERRDWDLAREADSDDAYSLYLQRYPNGNFVEAAQARREELRQQDNRRDEVIAAEAQENALGLTAFTRRLVETRLDNIGLEPGEVDGNFTGETRRALRRYQRDRQLEPTGFLNETTVVRLLADAIGR